MKYYDWNDEKNSELKSERNISFEQVIIAIEEGNVIARISHPNKDRYPHQKMFVICIEEYVYMVPFVEDEKKIFLKTIIPSRKATKQYLIEKEKK